MTVDRKNQPRCANCSHPKSFHAKRDGKCKAVGCKDCQAFVPEDEA